VGLFTLGIVPRNSKETGLFGFKKMTQMDKLRSLLQRKGGVKSWEITKALPSVSPHRRLSDLKEQGWTITFKMCPDNKTKIYFGKPPKK
jgi:hypothetical protein